MQSTEELRPEGYAKVSQDRVDYSEVRLFRFSKGFCDPPNMGKFSRRKYDEPNHKQRKRNSREEGVAG